MVRMFTVRPLISNRFLLIISLLQVGRLFREVDFGWVIYLLEIGLNQTRERFQVQLKDSEIFYFIIILGQAEENYQELPLNLVIFRLQIYMIGIRKDNKLK